MMKRAARSKQSSVRVLLVGVIAIVVWIYGVSPTFGQSDLIQIWLKVEPDTIYIGDPFIVTLSATYPSDYFVIFPRAPAQWGEFEVSGQDSTPTTDNGDGTLTSAVRIHAALFSVGDIPTPELSVAIRKPDGEIINRPVRPIDVRVDRIEADAGEPIDIKPQAELNVPPDPLSFLLGEGGRGRAIALGLVAAIALGIAVWFVWNRFLFPPQRIPSGPAEMAMRELDRIASMSLETEADFKERYTLVSDCIRTYLSGEYGVSAPELTTRQTMQSLGSSGLSVSAANDLERMLEECDLVKFARFIPGEEDAVNIVERGRKFVRETGVIQEAEGESVAVRGQTA